MIQYPHPAPFDFGGSECERKKTLNEQWAEIPAVIRSGILMTSDEYDKNCPNCSEDSVILVAGGMKINAIRVGQTFPISYYCPLCKTNFANGSAVRVRGAVNEVRLMDNARQSRARKSTGEAQVMKKRIRKR